MRTSCRHGGSATPRRWGWGWGGGGVIACGSVESYGIYTCGLFRRVGWNVSICIGFGASRSEQHGIYGVIACFQKAVFSGRSNPMASYIIIYTC